MKNYLNQKERKNIMIISALLNEIEDQLKKTKSMTLSERALLETIINAGDEYTRAIYERLDEKNLAELAQYGSKYGLKIFPVKSNEYQAIQLNEDEYLGLFEGICEAFCHGCNQDPVTCHWHRILTDGFAPEADYREHGCGYALPEKKKVEEKHRYKVYSQEGEPLIIGTATECAEKIGMKLKSFYEARRRFINGKYRKYKIFDMVGEKIDWL